MFEVQRKLNLWREQINALNNYGSTLPPHASNLVHKLGRRDAKDRRKFNAFENLIPEYIKFRNTVFDDDVPLDERFKEFVQKVNNYMSVLKSPICDVFNHQSDFSSSVIPEFFYILFKYLIELSGAPYEVSSQRDVIVECMFDPFNNGRLLLKKKSIDVAILLPCRLEFKGELREDFFIPLVALEIKTNMDKNMISGIEHSVESLKRTFPKCLYMAIAELADFAIERQNYSTTYIDEIYILRKQKRSAVRNGSQNRNDIDLSLINDLADNVYRHIEGASRTVPSLHERMIQGALISRRRE